MHTTPTILLALATLLAATGAHAAGAVPAKANTQAQAPLPRVVVVAKRMTAAQKARFDAAERLASAGQTRAVALAARQPE